MRAQAEALLVQVTRDAATILGDAKKKAEQTGSDAYTALREKVLLEHSVKATSIAVKNTVIDSSS